jgi:hypothetical protein
MRQIGSKVLGSLESVPSRLKLVFCLLLTCAGLLLGGAGITRTVYSQTCSNYNCSQGSCIIDLPDDCQDWCFAPKKMLHPPRTL